MEKMEKEDLTSADGTAAAAIVELRRKDNGRSDITVAEVAE